MKGNDLKPCNKVDKMKYCSQEKLDVLEKALSLPDCCGNFTDSNNEVEKQEHKPDHAINHCGSETLPRMERKCVSYDQVSNVFSHGCENSLKPQSSVASTSRISVVDVGTCKEGRVVANSKAVCGSVVIASSTGQTNLSIDNNPRDGDLSMHSSGTIELTQNISFRSDVSMETGQALNKEFNEFDVGGTKGCCLNPGEHGLKTVARETFPDKQHKTESSSSNSIPVIFPASSNDSCQDASVDGKSGKVGNSGMNSDISTGISCNLDEPVVKSILFHASAQTKPKAVPETSVFLPVIKGNVGEAFETVDNLRTGDVENVLWKIAGLNSGTMEKVVVPKSSLLEKKNAEYMDQDKVGRSCELANSLEVAWKVAREGKQQLDSYRETSGSSFSIGEKNDGTLHPRSVVSADLNKDCFAETGRRIKLCNEHLCLEVRGPSPKTEVQVQREAIDVHGWESSNSSAKSEVRAATDQTRHFHGFDLNKDIPANEVEYPKQSMNGTVSPHLENPSMPIIVVAKSGVPMSWPITPLQFEGELGWRGSAATSAFRPTLSKSSSKSKPFSTSDGNCCSKHSRCFKGIDLNVAAAGDDASVQLFPRKSPLVPSGFSSEESVNVTSKQAEQLKLDLNCLSENDNCLQSSQQTSLSKQSIGDFDLNDNPSNWDVSSDVWHPGQGTWKYRNKRSDCASGSSAINAKRLDLNSVGSTYWADLSSMQGFGHGHVQQFLVAAPNVPPQVEQMRGVIPLQPKLNYTPSQPHPYPYGNGVCLDPADPLSSPFCTTGALPCITDPWGTAFLSQTSTSGTLSSFPGASPIIEIVGRPRPSDVAVVRPRFDLNGGLTLPQNGNREGNGRQVLIPVTNTSMQGQIKSFQQAALSAMPMKRREPESGWDSHQLWL
ncbi:uncharacterized protein LOC131162304 [Malania oleifera]|uniref:uncharacterized protein LOC131162304 n=1 Tax=Malania oleifera TaxID=397392 RepID=UPI0025AE0C19|nr:uncharacterized protein LOC131162304 [Malania oleifera]XP_057974616.1 uncharacterized protein LOC131162304 [Malania oleifera]XP_057974617.1 uncharacterized protein LOC131162304 [Malania oleifera]